MSASSATKKPRHSKGHTLKSFKRPRQQPTQHTGVGERARRRQQNTGTQRGGLRRLRENWVNITAAVLLAAGTTGTVVHNMYPTCADHNGAIPRELVDDIVQASETSGIPPSVIAAQIHTESGWNENAQSPAGAKGLTQFMPETWETYGEGDITDPEASIKAQGKYLKDLRDMVAEIEPANEQEEIELILASYNAGPTTVLEKKDIPNYPETEKYIAQINDLAATRYANICAAH